MLADVSQGCLARSLVPEGQGFKPDKCPHVIPASLFTPNSEHRFPFRFNDLSLGCEVIVLSWVVRCFEKSVAMLASQIPEVSILGTDLLALFEHLCLSHQFIALQGGFRKRLELRHPDPKPGGLSSDHIKYVSVGLLVPTSTLR